MKFNVSITGTEDYMTVIADGDMRELVISVNNRLCDVAIPFDLMTKQELVIDDLEVFYKKNNQDNGVEISRHINGRVDVLNLTQAQYVLVCDTFSRQQILTKQLVKVEQALSAE